jgi:hypothetical protein
MAWQDEMTEVLRVMLNDLSSTPEFADEALQRVLVVAAGQVTVAMKFSQVFVADRVNRDITPDPTDDIGGTRDESFINLVTLKAGAIIDRGAARLAATQGIVIRDGSSMVDLRGQLGGQLKLLDKGWNAVYEEEALKYQAGQVRVAGAAVLGPFRLFAGWDNPYSYMPGEGRSAYNPFP